MTQGKYISENTRDILIRAEQILGRSPELDLTNLDVSIYIPGDSMIESLSPGCNRIIFKNIIVVTDASIVTCTGSVTTTCTYPPSPTCPTGGIVTPDKYVNMVATVNLTGVAQTGIVIQFNYLINDIPVIDTTQTQVTVSLVTGNNYVYLFPTNHTYSPDTSITLYGASVASY